MRPLIRTQSPRPGLLLLSPGDILMAAPELRTGQEQKELSNGRGRGRGPSLAYPLPASFRPGVSPIRVMRQCLLGVGRRAHAVSVWRGELNKPKMRVQTNTFNLGVEFLTCGCSSPPTSRCNHKCEPLGSATNPAHPLSFMPPHQSPQPTLFTVHMPTLDRRQRH